MSRQLALLLLVLDAEASLQPQRIAQSALSPACVFADGGPFRLRDAAVRPLPAQAAMALVAASPELAVAVAALVVWPCTL